MLIVTHRTAVGSGHNSRPAPEDQHARERGLQAERREYRHGHAEGHAEDANKDQSGRARASDSSRTSLEQLADTPNGLPEIR